MDFKEDFLHFLWRFRLFAGSDLHCTTGEKLVIVHPGILNSDAGPDFSEAKLQIGNTIWVGHVELHLRSSYWFMHHHQYDDAYDSVVLHVVYEHDATVYRKDGSHIPCFVLKGLFKTQLLLTYQQFLNSAQSFPCEKQIAEVPSVYVNGFMARLITERLNTKAQQIYSKLKSSQGNWAKVFYCFMAANFGLKVNTIPFELLADSIPYQLFDKHSNEPMLIEALIFGQAGFLNGHFVEAYPLKLKQEYNYLQQKYQLKPIAVSLWKFLRMRPQSFPTIRLAQFSALLASSTHLFSKLMDISDVKVMQQMFLNLPVHPYWNTHYHFGKPTAPKNNQLGMVTVNGLIINGVILFLYAYGKYINDTMLVERALNLLEQLPAEKNAVVKKYEDAGLVIASAFESQALLQLNKNYCTQKKCLNCVVGIKILNK
ncbi:DUF2851 family protein [Pedobacter sp. MC2016-14]|uniref:DUF2851 family protein n=1 Tax=Pedobacter sp. MC2016-14 TaxID=2897327 RepID=UPI001E5F4740|nr:DUF2851 family protein [Pedobacter sp. MC2016-14]MCD0488767.1 DUF2851 family protein [Pedobacter sp. MC2016-14]